MDKIEHISPSVFHYWEKCPYRAILSKQVKTQFPKNPDSDLGSLIHSFYEKRIEWGIDTIEKFNNKWDEEISRINEEYRKDELQTRFYPIQWHSKYYIIKKRLLQENLLPRKKKRKKKSSSDVKYLSEEKISDELISGKIDLLVKEGNKIKQVVEFKTGSIYENKEGKIQIKEIYKKQLALYCSVILEKQTFIPKLLIESIGGNRIKVEIKKEYINELIGRVKSLKERINSAIEKGTTKSIANPTVENCKTCSYRPDCEAYKINLINKRMGLNIDIKGEIIEVGINSARIKTDNKVFVLKNIKENRKYRLNKKCDIYNLYFPKSEEECIYETIKTLIIYE